MGWPRGSHHSMETKAKIGKANLGKHPTKETRKKLSIAKAGENSPWFGKHRSSETKQKLREANLDKPLSEETKSKISKAHKKLWQDPQFAKRSFEAFNKTPNKPEKMLMEILDSNFTGGWKFVGDGQFFLGGLCPDFININGKKKIIEMFGTYWHKTRENIKYHQTEDGRREIFKEYGYDLLVIWEDELKDKDAVLEKVREFMK